MEVRYIANDNEAVEYLKVSAASFIWKFDKNEDTHCEMPVLGAFHEGKLIAGVEIFDFKTNFCGNTLGAVIASGVCSQPEYRRMGGIRAIFEKIEETAEENNWKVGFLHPFSIEYYEKFGYAMLNRMLTLKVPFESLKNIPRCTDVTLYTGEQTEELCELHNKCALRENLICFRNDKKHFCDTPLESADYTYIHRDKNGTADGYVRFTVKRPEALTVEELYVLSPEALSELIGFLRNYDGLVKHLIVKNQYQGSPFAVIAGRLDGVISEHCVSAAGRIYNLKAVLENNQYPEEYGKFRLKSIDTISRNNGVFEVEYSHKRAKITYSPDGEYDIALTAPAAARLLLAGEGHNKDTAVFIDGVELKNDASDFFRAFPHRFTRFADSCWSI